MVGLSRVLESGEAKKEVDDLVKEGQSLTEKAGKGIANEEIEKWEDKCKVLIEQVTAGKVDG